jgi:ATPase subunit of ABC transporter with duplicated ATPase domains
MPDSIGWLRDYLKGYKGGLVIISHDVAMLDTVVNRVFHLDANRSEIDHLQRRLEALPPSARDRRTSAASRERPTRRRRRQPCMAQADKMRAKATKTVAAQNMARRAERLPVRARDRARPRQGRQAALPQAVAVRQDPLRATGLSRSYGSQEIFTDVDLAIDRGSRVVVLGPQRCRQDDPAAHARRRRHAPDTGRSSRATA